MPTFAVFVRPLSLLALIALAPTVVAAEVYRWKDANGVTNYGERPPAGQQAERVAVRPEPAADPASIPADTVDESSLSEEERAEAARLRAIAAAAEERTRTREAACARAQLNLQVLRENNIVSLRDGETTRALDATERDQQIAENEAAEARHCQPETEPNS